MALTENKKYAIIPIEKDWSNFSIEQNGKHIHLLGYDGKTLVAQAGYFNIPKDQQEEVVLYTIEQHWANLAIWDILDDASDDDGYRYLILIRTE